ncbi:serine hydrolase [Paenibacillus thiaminolyticus]|uniref:Class A beta-lactamase-related serine hydrolase n=1 Tax=Paenibacillus thiaminolyticus TaxID=49283 RepID=A0A3A3G9M6_PANTH|nr:serine hydrolase domain-containing protein [Paenibacillus thiaminolyticus]RJG17915.1 class A beta-lactamase-related serine hydrolase [Paenibacillus thiaminolyticus]
MLRTCKAFADEFFARQDVKASGVPEAVFVLVKDGKVQLQKGYGYANVEKKSPVAPEKTLFRIASVSKVFTAAAVMQLDEQGKIELNRDVLKFRGYQNEEQYEVPRHDGAFIDAYDRIRSPCRRFDLR